MSIRIVTTTDTIPTSMQIYLYLYNIRISTLINLFTIHTRIGQIFITDTTINCY